MVFEWLKDLLFTPKRRQIAEIEDFLTVLDQRIRRLEGNAGVSKREEMKAEKQERMNAAIAEASAMLTAGKDQGEIAKTILAKYPDLALDLAKRFGVI